MLTSPPVLRASRLPQLGGIRGPWWGWPPFVSDLRSPFYLASAAASPGHLTNRAPVAPDLTAKQDGAGEASGARLKCGLVPAA